MDEVDVETADEFVDYPIAGVNSHLGFDLDNLGVVCEPIDIYPLTDNYYDPAITDFPSTQPTLTQLNSLTNEDRHIHGLDFDSLTNNPADGFEYDFESDIEFDPRNLSLFYEAIAKGEETDNTIRVNVVGNYAQGKTSLTKRLIGQTAEGVQSTNGVDINRCRFTDEVNHNVVLKTKSITDDEEPNEILDRIYSVAQSENKRQSYTELNFDQQIFENTPTAPAYLPEEQFSSMPDETHTSGTEKRKSIISKEELDKFAKHLIRKKFKRDSFGDLDIWDFAGQYIFYATHTLFHSRRAVYILVFDLSVPLNKTTEDYDFPGDTGNKTMGYFARFWMNSIHSYVGSDDGKIPPVVFVGTHKDKLEGDEDAKEEFKDAYFDQVRTLFEDTKMLNHIQPADFVTDNTDREDGGIVELRKEIVRLGKRTGSVKIPARWIPLEKALKEIRNQKIITFESVMNINSKNEFPLDGEEQVKLFLLYHHTKGTLFYFDEEPICDFVVLDPQYLIDAFKCIITSGKFCKKIPTCRRLWNLLMKDARLEKELVDQLWDKDIHNGFITHKNTLLMFLQKHYIISEALEYDTYSKQCKGLEWYIVPSLLRDHSTEDTLKDFLMGKRQTSVRYVMSFSNSPVVQIVYHRLLAASIGKWPVAKEVASYTRSLLYENLCVLRLDDVHVGITEKKDGNIELVVVSLIPSSNVNCEIADRFRRFSESVVMNELQKFKTVTVKQMKPYTVHFRCNHDSHGLNGSKTITPLDDLTNKKLLPCPDLLSHEINIEVMESEWFLKDEVPNQFPDRPLNERQLSKFAQSVGENWELLGLEIGLTEVQIQQISMDNQTSALKIYKMLTTWKETEKEKATVSALLKAMKNTKRVYIGWDEVRNIIDKMNNEESSDTK